MSAKTPGYPDLHDHLEELQRRGLLRVIDRPIDKDSELHPLVRWQFVGGMGEAERKAFLFTNIVNAQGRKYDMPVVVGALAANRATVKLQLGKGASRGLGAAGDWCIAARAEAAVESGAALAAVMAR